jgi:hypothetical protein
MQPWLGGKNHWNATHGAWARDEDGPRRASPEWTSWQGMKNRCYNRKNNQYKRYGKRGIRVCARWLASFENFLEDMGKRPKGRTLDRIDNNGNYDCGKCPDCRSRGVTKSNCRWATKRQQANNTRSTVMLTLDGVTKPLRDWAKERNLEPRTVWSRLRRGFSVERALMSEDGRATRHRLGAAGTGAYSTPVRRK